MEDTNSTLEKNITMVLSQTDLTREIATEKLKTMEPIDIIKEYMGIPIHDTKKQITKQNLNQEIFKNMRSYLDKNTIQR